MKILTIIFIYVIFLTTTFGLTRRFKNNDEELLDEIMEDIEDDKRSLLDTYADFPGIRMNEKTWKNIVENCKIIHQKCMLTFTHNESCCNGNFWQCIELKPTVGCN
ncbi:uncharacterized protein LOC130613742 [Hydractinia symbiolongicarpus]|uniref:uncharacterized protein LOC130613742 n=1 Tax=Hydractinia symbiolongicarpus TaxID=13093 RepID=UPI00254E5DD7|nr:uncharacterized protein LOC130613742 [Hydractinia symbiolongicarpus]